MKLLNGGLSQYIVINGIKVAAAPRQLPPFAVEVMVFEEDTNLILTVDPVIEYEEQHPIRIMTALMETKKHTPGSVVINGSSWYAVVLDLDRDPVCKQEWCTMALEQVFDLAEHQKISSLALPLLGTMHGGLQIEQQVEWLLKKISTIHLTYLKRLWLVVTPEDVGNVKKVLACSLSSTT